MAQVLTPEGLNIVYNFIQIHSHHDYRQQTGISDLNIQKTNHKPDHVCHNNTKCHKNTNNVVIAPH